MLISCISIFHFQLWPVEQITPWSGNGRECLHWFGLTDGAYGIDCRGTELLRTNQRIIDATPEFNWRTPLMDYNVARLYEDVLELLPFAVDPIPPDIAELIRTRNVATAFESRSREWCDNHWPPASDDDPHSAEELDVLRRHSELWDDAAGWWSASRRLSRGHVAGQPDIQIFTIGDTTTIRWTNDCSTHAETSLPWNVVTDGEIHLPRAEFIAEVEQFHNRLMHAMREQICEVHARLPWPNVDIDIDELEREQAERTRCFAETLERSARLRPDWNVTRQAIRRIRAQLGE